MKRGDHINQLLRLGGKKGYFHHESYWFHHLKLFPGLLIDPNGYVRFETEQEYLNNPLLRIQPETNQVHALPNITVLSGYRLFSTDQLALLAQEPGNLLEQPTAPTDAQSLHRKRQIQVIIRDKRLVARIKKKHADTCQLCGMRIQIRPGRYYSEVHHIQPLGQPHNGPDHESNMLCVCPNHHTLLDFFTISLDFAAITSKKHPIDPLYVAYHNERHTHFNPS